MSSPAQTPTRTRTHKRKQHANHIVPAADPTEEDVGANHAPNTPRTLRACLMCSFVHSRKYFIKNGCPNCVELIDFRGDTEQTDLILSTSFEGLIFMNPRVEGSWVAQWQRIDGYVRGMYAIKVVGNLPEYVENELEIVGRVYHKRDGSWMPQGI